MEFKNTVEKQKIIDNTIINAIVNLVKKNGEVSNNLTKIRSNLYATIPVSIRSILPKNAAALRVVLNRIDNRLKVRSIRVNFNRSEQRVCTINSYRSK